MNNNLTQTIIELYREEPKNDEFEDILRPRPFRVNTNKTGYKNWQLKLYQ